ncbi:hypothetical protein N7493_006758 [Penicillium malachiteum]|uniref:ABC transporter domain-containing protein n=1 Tax=Penicillium malachiteum TaxID=1324776 RepID=A0AAD6HJA6_9EURO|nr:hypothetical protein N7493_006758 [Penicillium malachiteum]
MRPLFSLIILLSGWYLLANHTGGAMLGLVMNYVLSLTNVVNQMVTIRAALEFDMVSIQRILEYGHLEPEHQIKAHPLSRITPLTSWPEEGRVEFDDVWAKYRSDLPFCLQGTSFTVRQGQKVAIVGRTGAGKSSIALALGRFIEALQGSILIDGYDIAQIELKALRRHIGVIPQQAEIFKGTIRLNLDPEGVHDDADLRKALEESQLSDILDDKPDLLDNPLEQAG